jgi:hypothetical protein
LPQQLDPRIATLTGQLVSASRNRYDAARVVEAYLQNEFGYTLEQRLAGATRLQIFCLTFAKAIANTLRRRRQ